MTWQEFWTHHDKQHYTPVFNTFLESQIEDSKLPLLTRVLAWILRNSWGWHSNDVIDSDGIRQSQADCARALNLFRTNKKGEVDPDRQKVNPAFLTLERLRLIRFEGRDIFPIADPSSFAPHSPDEGMGSSVSEQKAKLTVNQFIERVWSVANPKAYAEYQTAERQYKELRTTLINDFKIYVSKSERGRTSEENRPDGERQDVGKGADKASERGATSPAPSLNRTTKRYKRESAAAATFPETSASQDENPPPLLHCLKPFSEREPQLPATLLQNCRNINSQATAAQVAHFVYEKTERAQDAENPVGFLLSVIPACFAGNYQDRLPGELLTAPPAPRKRMDKAAKLKRWLEEGNDEEVSEAR